MKTVTGRVVSAEPISLSKAATLLSEFASSDNRASQDVSAYLRQASAAFTELKSFHREIKSKETKPSSDARRERNVTGEFDGGKIRDRKSEAMSEDSVYGREQEDKKKKKKNKYEDVIDEKVKEKLEDEERSVERKERKKKRKSEEEMGSEERKNKKKRKSDEEMGSEERKGKKKRKSKGIDG